MDYINYDSDEDSCIVDDVDLEECDRRQETDLPPVNDLEFIASMAADFTYDYGSIAPANAAPAPLQLSTPMEDGDSSDDDSSSGESVAAAPATADADADKSSSDSDSSDSEEEVVVTKKGYQKASKQISWLTEEEEEGSSGPLKTKNEIDEPIEAVNPDLLTIADTSTLTCIGQVMYRIDHECVVVIQADFTTSPLNEGSLLCNVDGKVLGKVQEIFGPITTPYYTVKWRNTPSAGAGEKGKNAQAGGGKNAKNNKNKKGGKKAPVDAGIVPEQGAEEIIAAEPETTTQPLADVVEELECDQAVAEAETSMEVAAQGAESVEATGVPTTDDADLPTEEVIGEAAAATAAAVEPGIPTPPPNSALAIADVRALFPVGAKLFSAPAHCSYVLAGQLQKLYGRGSDASNAYDEEPGQDEVEYSDDEQEMLAKQARKQALGRGRAAAAAVDPNTVGNAIPTGYEGYGRGGGGGRGGRGAGRGRDGAFRGSRPAAGASSGYGSGSTSTGQAPLAYQPPMPTMQMPMMPHMGQQPMMQPMMAPMGAPMMQQFPGGMMYAAPQPYAMMPTPVPYASAQPFRPPPPPSAAPGGPAQQLQQQAQGVPFMTAPAPAQGGHYGYAAAAPMQPAGGYFMQPGQGMPQAAGYSAQQYPQYPQYPQYQQQGQFPPQQGQQAGGALPQYQHQPLQFGAPPAANSGSAGPQQPSYSQRK